VLTHEQRAQQQLRAKLHPSVLAVVNRVKAGVLIQSPDEAKFVTGGKADLQIWLTDKNDEALAALKELGVEVIADPRTSRLLIARVALEKLEALGQLKWVKYVAPSTKR
jgi:riboflavin biosynthesis pyrimidine reductase